MQLKRDTLLERGKYRILATLGQGGFGITYLAEQTLAGRKVCIKEYFPKDYYNRDADTNRVYIGSKADVDTLNRYKEKFIKEASVLARLKHPHIVSVYDVFEENDTAYYVMEHIEGESLGDVVKRRGALDEATAVGYIRQIASALGYIHEQNINHLDVKPGNVMVSSEDDSAILIDFGLAKHYDTSGGQTSSTPVGISHGYAPFEQYKSGGVSSFSPATDIYSLGATLYYLVTGEVPPSATDIEEDGIGALPQHISPGIYATIEKSMNFWRKQRPQSIKEFLALLDGKDTVTPNIETTALYIEVADSKTELLPKVEPSKPAPPREEIQPNNEIWYTSSDGKVVKPSYQGIDVFGAEIVSNTYKGGKGIIKFKDDVTTIGEMAFSFCKSLTSVTIPDSVTTIGNWAFDGCKNLENVTIPNSVTMIGNSAFGDCSSINEFNGKFASPDGRCLIINGKLIAFAPAGITEYTIPNGVTTIGNGAFSFCKSLKSVIIPNGVTTIEKYAFWRCSNLTSVTIPNSVTTIGGSAFAHCSSIKEFNGKFASPDGRCLIINGKLVAFAPAGIAGYTIPNSVTTIGEKAFSGCDNLTSVTIPNSVTTIGDYTFEDCENLTSVTIPNSVTTIEKNAFFGCNLSEDTKDKIRKINRNALFLVISRE